MIFFYNFTMWKSKYDKFYKNQVVFRDNMEISLLGENLFSYEQTLWRYNVNTDLFFLSWCGSNVYFCNSSNRNTFLSQNNLQLDLTPALLKKIFCYSRS